MNPFEIESCWIMFSAASAVFIYFYLTWTHSYWRRRGIPYVQPKLIFGSIKEAYVGKKSLAEVYEDIYWDLNEHRFGGLFKFRQPVILLRDPEIIKLVTNTHFDCFPDNDFQIDIETYPLIGRNPFFLQGPMWKELKSKLLDVFSSERVYQMFPLIQESCNNMVEHLKEDKSKEILRELKDLSRILTADIVASCAYGIKQNSFQNSETEFWIYCNQFLKPTLRKALVQLMLFMSPTVANFFKLRIVPSKLTIHFKNKIKETVLHREKNNIQQNDYLQLLVEMKNKTTALNNKAVPWYKKFTDEDIAAQALTFFTEGYLTTSTTLAVLLYHLACNTYVQDRLIYEIDQVVTKYNGTLNLNVIEEMKYLDMVVKESLRLHPPIAFMTRLCKRPFQIPNSDGSSFTVDVGTPVVIPILAIQNDPVYFPNPKQFDPQHFSKDNIMKQQSCTFMPFGVGPRRCLGTQFALAQIKYSVVSILRYFKIRKFINTPGTLTAMSSAFIYTPKERLNVKFINRIDT